MHTGWPAAVECRRINDISAKPNLVVGMVQFLNPREPQAFLVGLGMLLVLSMVAVAILDGIVVAGLELLAYFTAVR